MAFLSNPSINSHGEIQRFHRISISVLELNPGKPGESRVGVTGRVITICYGARSGKRKKRGLFVSALPVAVAKKVGPCMERRKLGGRKGAKKTRRRGRGG
eukprot:91125-Amorphochlora_amoeboformis.AAC.1